MFLIGCTVVILVLALILLHFVVNRPFKAFAKGIREIARGNFAYRIPERGRDEMAQMARSLNRMSADLGTRMMALFEDVQDVLKQSRQVMSQTEQVSQRAAQQLTLAEGINQKTDHLTGVAERAEDISQQVAATSEKMNEGLALVKRVSVGFEKVIETIQDIARNVKQLEQSSNRISQISLTIRDIADQTNLLALNATIEAARAGEAGKGFAVVANEVKELSRRTQEATEQIESLVKTIQVEMKTNVQNAETGGQRADEARNLMAEFDSFFNEMLGRTNEVSDMVTEIGHLTQEVLHGIREAVTTIHSIAMETNEDVSRLTDASAAMDRAANSLKAMETFRFK